MRKSTLWDALTGITPTHPTEVLQTCSDKQLGGDLQPWELEETFQPMNLLLSQARMTYSSPSTLFEGNLFNILIVHAALIERRERAKKNHIYTLSITHLKRKVKKFNCALQFRFGE